MLLPFFGFTSSTSMKHFTFEDFFHCGKQKKKSLGARAGERWTGKVEHGGLWSKTAKYSGAVQVSVLLNHPSWNGQKHWKSFKKHSLTLNAASDTTTSWCTDTDGLLQHYPSGGRMYYKGPALQKIIPFFGGTPSYVILYHTVILFLINSSYHCSLRRLFYIYIYILWLNSNLTWIFELHVRLHHARGILGKLKSPFTEIL